MKRIFTVLIAILFVGYVAGQNVLLNGDFESWDDDSNPTSWTKAENVTKEAVEVHTVGGFSAKHVGGTKDLAQTISGIIPGKKYKLEIWYKVVESDGTDARIWSKWSTDGTLDHDTDKDVLQGPGNAYLPNNGGEWSTYTTTVTAPTGVNEFYFEVRTYSGATTYWDDFSFTMEESNEISIINIVADKKVPTAAEGLTITCDVENKEATDQVGIGYQVDGVQVLTPVPMVEADGKFTGTIPAQADGALVEFAVAVVKLGEMVPVATSDPISILWGTTPISKVKTMDADGALVYKGMYARVTGVATVPAGTFAASRLDVFMQDASAGINLFSFDSNYSIVEGNSYTVVGKIDQYNGKSEIVPSGDADITDNGAVTAVAPLVVSMADLLANPEDYEGELISVLNADTMNVQGEWPQTSYDMTDDAGTSVIKVYMDGDTDISGSEAPEVLPLTIVGIFSQYDSSSPYDGGYQILPRKRADIISVATGLETEIETSLSIYSYGRTLVINSDQVSRATVYNLAGQVVREMNVEAGRNEFTMDRGGIHIVRVNNEIQKVVLR